METCYIEACRKQTRVVDVDGFCEDCHALAVKIRARIAAGHLMTPDHDLHIGGRPMPITPNPRDDVFCSACEGPFTSLSDQEQELDQKGDPLYLHRRCRQIMDCL